MSGHKNFNILREQVLADPERRARIEDRRRMTDAILTLAELRAQRGMTQEDIARSLDVTQANISRLERRHDAYVSTVAEYVAALGGYLRVVAVFPDQKQEVDLRLLSDLPATAKS